MANAALFHSLAKATERRLGRFAARELAITCKSELAGIATAALGISWAFSFAGILTTSALETIREVITHVGYTFDALHAEKNAQICIPIDGSYAAAKH